MEPSRNWKEIIAPGEEEHFRELAGLLVRLQQMHAVNGQVGRALHNKQLGGFEAKLEVFGNIPEYGRYGLFAQPRLYDAVVRYSNGASNIDSDQTPDVRGMAVKVLCGTGAVQDFLAVLQPHSPFRNADEFVGVIWASRNKLLALPRIFWAVGFRMFPILIAFKKSISPPPQSVAGRTFHSGLPILCGPYAIRFRWVPLANFNGSASSGPNRLGDDLAVRLKDAPLEYALELQFFVDEARTPIEDGSVDWPEEVSPGVRVGKLTIAQQDASSEKGQKVAAKVKALSFSPWNGLPEHRPLGNMMRARKAAYSDTGKTRSAVDTPEVTAP